ncbi:hypothetical protein ACEWY4_015583 [Coilia grayii]|uniref:Ig-like domain-containing protein n=1 Tax=Coilia grayii TaxID=363190 RepID=A0ABD1JNI3_9TELE
MKTVLGFLVLLQATFSQGLQSMCNATQDAVCYGALGGPVHLQLIRDTTGHEIKLYSGADRIKSERVFTLKNSKTVFHLKTPSLRERWQFVPENGILIINPAESTDSGMYRVEIHDDSTGKSEGDHVIQLIIAGLACTRQVPCHVAVGQPVSRQLMVNAAGYELKLYNHTSRREGMFTFKNSKTVFHNEFNTPSFLQRWQFVPGNGTLIINPAESTDSGLYKVEIYEDSTGRLVGEQEAVLNIAAPVSDVDLSISCPITAERRVRCSSNGDSPQYSWSLDGRALSGADAHLSTDNQTVLLKGNVIGQLTCTVSNHISTTSITRVLFCPDILVISIIGLCGCLFLCVAVVTCYICRKKRNTHTLAETNEC